MITFRQVVVVAPCLFLTLSTGCADPCVDDGIGQGGCPEAETESASAGEATLDGDGDGSGDSQSSDGGNSDSESNTNSDTDTNEGGDGDGDGTGDGDTQFDPGTFIIPMDTVYQDDGMLTAFGLVYALLLEDIPIYWIIAPGKGFGEEDFTSSSTDFVTDEVITNHGYRGGPFVVPDFFSDQAEPIIIAWQAEHPDTTVHRASEPFLGWVHRRLLTAPTLALFADGNEHVARGYLLAAGIPDSTGDASWPDDSPDMLDPGEVMGASQNDHADGALFDGQGEPQYCQFMSMHWDVEDAEVNAEVVAEVREFLNFPTHFFAECEAVNAFENNANGHFLTPKGLEIVEQPLSFDYFRMDSPFGQLDGSFMSVGGSEPAYNLPAGDAYYQADSVIVTDAGTPEGEGDVWMTGFLDGACPSSETDCGSVGKISYLGGHEYETQLPISEHPDTNGVRFFLNSLFEAPCALD